MFEARRNHLYGMYVCFPSIAPRKGSSTGQQGLGHTSPPLSLWIPVLAWITALGASAFDSKLPLNLLPLPTHTPREGFQSTRSAESEPSSTVDDWQHDATNKRNSTEHKTSDQLPMRTSVPQFPQMGCQHCLPQGYRRQGLSSLMILGTL